MTKRSASIVITAAEGHLEIDFGDRLIITGPGPSQRPRRGEPFLSLCLIGRDKFDWETKLQAANLGIDLTTFVTKLANVAGAEVVKVYPGKVELTVSVFANSGMQVHQAVVAIYGVEPAIGWKDGRPIYPSSAPPYSHAGL